MLIYFKQILNEMDLQSENQSYEIPVQGSLKIRVGVEGGHKNWVGGFQSGGKNTLIG